MDTMTAMGVAIVAVSAGLFVGAWLSQMEHKRRKPGTPVTDMHMLQHRMEHKCSRCGQVNR